MDFEEQKVDGTEARGDVLEFPCDANRLPGGNTLITDAGDEMSRGSKVLEVTPDKQIVWRHEEGLKFAHSAKRLAGGNTLIADTNNDRVFEVTPAGETVFSSDDWGGGTGKLSDGSHLHYPNKAKQTVDGNLLITDRNNDRAVLVDREGNVLWQLAGELKHPHNASLLDGGNLIVADSDGNTVREYTRDGRLVWSYGDGTSDVLHWPRDADRLANGNTLITDSKHHRVIEVTPAGQIVWQFQVDHWANFYEAQRLAGGNTLIADQQHHQVLEVNPLGEVVWRFHNYPGRPYPVREKLANCRFEQVDDDGRPAGWVLCTRLGEGGGRLAWTQNAAAKRCPGIEYDRRGGVWLQQTRTVTGGKTYRVSGLLSTEDLDGFACVQIAFCDAQGAMFCDAADNPRSDLFSGTTPWSREIFAATAPPKAVAADIRFFVTGSGRAFVDELFCFG
jgi:hypothetical protein